MIRGNTKRVVVIKDIPSNYIEEAILILKAKPGMNIYSNIKESLAKGKVSQGDDYLVKEAELIISNYVKENEKNGGAARDSGSPPRPIKDKFLTNTIINLVLIGSLSLLIFLISRMF